MVTIETVLNRPLFHTAFIAAGAEYTDRPIHWVHVGEIPNLGQFLQGHELVLATGMGLRESVSRIRFLEGLIHANAAGLVLELGQYLPEVPADLIALANRHQFPIIAFPYPVRFLDLSQDINSLVISQHHRIMDDLETLSLKIRQALLNTDGPAKLVELLGDSMGQPVLFLPRVPGELALKWGSWPPNPGPFSDVALHPVLTATPHPFIRQTILVFDKPVGDLLVAHPGTPIDERVYLALDRTAAAIAQDFIRTESLDRVRRREEAAILEHLLFEESPDTSQIQRFRSQYHVHPGRTFRVLVIDHPTPAATSVLRRWLSVGATCVELDQKERTILVAVGPAKIIGTLPHAIGTSWVSQHRATPLGLSALHHDPANLHQAFSEANDAAAIACCLGQNPASYEEMGIFRWILSTPRQQLERLLIAPELGPLLDQADTPRLLETLEALLAHLDSKQAASQRLGIHRQTLYARIRTLSQFLGEDFLSPSRRLALEAALAARHYLVQSAAAHGESIP